jgi:hypothetical protein
VPDVRRLVGQVRQVREFRSNDPGLLADLGEQLEPGLAGLWVRLGQREVRAGELKQGRRQASPKFASFSMALISLRA